ncbi:MAG TPA: glycosyltransferase family 2 protein [Ignavibacteriaceae bacterium]|nr:glycosyltransferase family 2 protein [Ignavibacteriaceae bacterium]
MELSIIIINYNSKQVLLNCLHSLLQSPTNISSEIFVIDNASTESIKDVEQQFPEIVFIFNEKNIGFAAANNIGIKESKGRYILLLNPDTIVNDDSFPPMIQYLEKHDDVGIVGCKIFNADGEIERSTHSFPSLLKEFVHANEFIKNIIGYDSWIAGPLKKIFRAKSLESYWDHNSIKEVDHVTGACMMVKREAIDKVGLLDEAFFLYNEEVEWSLRMKQAGYKSVFVPDSSIIHLFGYSTKQGVQKQTINKLLVERYRGMFYFFQKHYIFIRLLMLRIIVLQGFCLRLFLNYLKSSIATTEHKTLLIDETKYIKKILSLVRLNNFDWRMCQD